MLRLALSTFVLLTTLSQLLFAFEIKLENVHLTEQNIKFNWDSKLSKSFPKNISEPITGIDMLNAGTDVEGFNKLLEYNLSGLKQLNLTRVRMTDDLFKKIVEQPFFKNLEILKLNQCLLHSSDLYLIEAASVRWKYLDISGNQIDGQGIKHLATISMNLTTLKLSQTYLYEESSVDALIQIGLTHLEQLYLNATSLKSDGLLKILNQCNTSKLVNLTIGDNNYPTHFYESLSKISFPNLRVLGLSGLLIDQEGAKYLAKWKLPSLQVLNFQRNFFRTSQGKMVFTNVTMPKLQSINLDINQVDAQIFRHFNSEGFRFTQIYCTVATLRSSIFRYLSESDLSKLQVLKASMGIGNPSDFLLFIGKSDLSELKFLDLSEFSGLGDVFGQILMKNFPKLEKLLLPKSGLFHIPRNATGTLPCLKQLTINLAHFEKQEIKNFILKIKELAPSLETLNLQLQPIPARDLCFDIVNNELSNISSRIKLNGFKGISFILEPNQKPKVKTIDYHIFKNVLFSYINEGQMKHLKQPEIYKQLQFQKNLMTIRLASSLNFSETQVFAERKNLELLSILLGKNETYRHLSEPELSKNIEALQVTQLTPDGLHILEAVDFPAMVSLSISPIESFEKKFDPSQLSVNLNNFRDLSSFQYTGNSVSPDLCTFIIESVGFRRLYSIGIRQAGLSSESYSRIVSRLKNYQRFIGLNLGGNAFRSLQSVFDEDMKLIQLQLDMNPLGESIVELSRINYQFLKALDISVCEINDDIFINYLENLTYLNQLPFPQLRFFQLSLNYIQIYGFQKLFQVGLPLINQLQIIYNNDPEIFNTVFKSPFSRRLQIFQSYENSLESISAQISPSHTRRLIAMVFQGESLLDTDFPHLERLQFASLIQIIFFLKKIGSCQTLNSVRKISKNSTIIQIIFQEYKALLNDSCLKDDPYVHHITPLFLQIITPGYYFHLQEFTSSFINENQDIQEFAIQGPGCPSNTKMLSMLSTSPLNNLKIFVSQFCEFNDTVIKELFKKDLPVLQSMSCLGNQELTGAALQAMHGRYPRLQFLDLGKTYIGYQGLKILVENCEFPELVSLSLADIDITPEGIKQLNSLKAPKLEILDVSCNNLSFDDLKELKLPYEKFPLLKRVRIFPQLQSEIKEKLESILSYERPFEVEIQTFTLYLDIKYLNDDGKKKIDKYFMIELSINKYIEMEENKEINMSQLRYSLVRISDKD